MREDASISEEVDLLLVQERISLQFISTICRSFLVTKVPDLIPTWELLVDR